MTVTQAQWSTNPNNNLIVGYGLNPKICSDSAGGCYVSYEYNSTDYPRWLALERLDKYGYKSWGINKRILGEYPQQYRAKIVEDGEGGVIVSYIDRFENLPTWFERVRVQRIDSSGNFLWGSAGVKVTMDEINQGLQDIVSDGSGGCVVAWKTVNSLFYVNRINANGERLWSDSGKLLGISHYSGTEPKVIRAADGNYYAETGEYIYRIMENGEIVRRDSVTLGYIVPDPEGGIVLSGRVGNINNRRLVAQRKDSLGNNLWQEPYVEIADSLHINTMLSIVQKNGYYFYGWMGKKNGNNEILQIQGIRNNGTILFNQGSISLSSNPGLTTYIPIIPSDSGSCIFISSYTNGTFGQKIDTLGSSKWNHSQVLLNYPQLGLDRSFVITDCIGGAIGIGVYLTDFGIPVFKASSKGILGEVIPVELISFTGKVKNNSVELNWQTATELNNMGFEVQKLKDCEIERLKVWEVIGFVEGNGTTTQTNTYIFIDKNITDGNYKYRLKQFDFDGSYEYSNEISVEVNFLPKEYLLYQNYPNPFNSSTIIKYQIPQAGRVRINLFNILGEKILTLFEGERKAGEYQVSLSSDVLPSGNYFYSLESGSFRSVKKLTIIK